MNEADERRYEYEAQQRAPKPEPVYEYRVVCVDQVWKPASVSSFDEARKLVEEWGDRFHAHTIERRLIGPWEAT